MFDVYSAQPWPFLKGDRLTDTGSTVLATNKHSEASKSARLNIQLTRTACLMASVVDSSALVPRKALSSTLFTVLSSDDTFDTMV